MSKSKWGTAVAVVFFGLAPFLSWLENVPHYFSLGWLGILIFAFYKWANAPD